MCHRDIAIPIWKASASAVGGRSPSAPIEDIPLRKHNPGWSASFLLEKSLEFNKKCKSMEQLLAYQQWDLCMGFIDAAAPEKLAQHLLGVYKDEGVTVQDAYDLGTTPLRPSEAPIRKVTPAGILEKCKWRTTIDGSSEKEGEHYHGSSHHAAPSQDSVRLWFAQESNVPIHERCGQADVSSAYNVAGVGNDAHGNPAKIEILLQEHQVNGPVFRTELCGAPGPQIAKQSVV
jgi:hypothetical protein